MTLSRSLSLLLPACALAACNSGPASAPSASAPAATAAAEPAPTLRLPEDVRPTSYQLALDLDPKQPRFSGHVTINAQLDRAQKTIWLHGRGLHVTSATVKPANGNAVQATWKEVTTNPDGFASLTLPEAVGPGAVAIEIAWDTAYNERLVSIYKAPEAGVPYVFSQFEAIDARGAFPCFDEPVFKTPFDISLTVPADDVAATNTLAIEEKKDGAKKTVRFATTKPLPTYILNFAVGPFDVVEHEPLPPNEVRKRPLPLRGIAPHGRGPELAVALDAAAKMLVTEERYFGIEFPYDKLDHIAVPDYAYGAMENAGSITYREDALFYVEGKTPFTARRGIYSVIAHEMAHQWFGDYVTLRWWTDAWLNEAFATWMAARTVDTTFAGENERMEVQTSSNGAMGTDALAAARSIRQPVNATGDIWNQFDALTYQKGAAVIGMFERWMGEDKFRTGVSSYLKSHAYGGGSTDDLLRSYSEAAGRDVATPFKTFIEQAGVPLVEASLSCAGGKAAVALKQSRYLPLGSTAPHDQRWQIPVCVRYGSGATAKESCTLVTEPAATLALDGACPAWVMPNAGGVGYYRWSLPAKELAALSANWQRLDARERLSFAYNVQAGMHSGNIAAADGLRALALAARDTNGTVASQPDITLREIIRMADPALRAKASAYYGSLYRPVLARLGWTPKPKEDSPTRELRAELISTAVLFARDPAVRKQALAKGHALFDAKAGALHLDAVDPDLRTPVLAVVLQEDGKPAYDALMTLLDKTTDAALRGQLIDALYMVTDPALFDRSLAMMSDTRHVQRGERIRAIFLSTAMPENGPRVISWFQTNADAVLLGMPETQASGAPNAFRRFYGKPQLEAVRAIFEPRLGKVAGMKRAYDQAVESITLNIAYAEKQTPSLTSFFAAAH